MSDLMRSLVDTAKWCKNYHRGILTPTGKQKKLPTYFVVQCEVCDSLTLTSSKVALAKRFECSAITLGENPSNKSAPKTIVCKGGTEILRRI